MEGEKNSSPENVIEAKLFAGRPWRRQHCCCGSLWRQCWRFPERQARAPRPRLKVERQSQVSRVRRERRERRGAAERQPGLRGGEGWGGRHGRAVERQRGVCRLFQRGFREAEAGEAATEVVLGLELLRTSGEARRHLVTVGEGDRHLGVVTI